MQQIKDKVARDKLELDFVAEQNSVSGFKELKLSSFFFLPPFFLREFG